MSFFYFCRVKNEGGTARDKTSTVCSPPETNIAAYGGVECFSLQGSTAKTVSLTSEKGPSPESQQDCLHFYAYIVYVK